MNKPANIHFQEESDFKKLAELVLRNWIYFVVCMVLAFGWAVFMNYYTIPVYQITSSVLIKEDNKQGSSGSMNDFLNSSLFGKNQSFQNELWTLQATPVIAQTIKNLDLSVSYYRKDGFLEYDAYKQVPFKVLYSIDHVQPLNVRFKINFLGPDKFTLSAEGDNVPFYIYSTNMYEANKEKWAMSWQGAFGKLIQTKDFSFIIERDSAKPLKKEYYQSYSFELIDVNSLVS
jgi:hypothetical protein